MGIFKPSSAALSIVVTLLLAFAPTSTALGNNKANKPVSLLFEENVGQFAEGIDFISRAKGYRIALTSSGPIIELSKAQETPNKNIKLDAKSEDLGVNQNRAFVYNSFQISLANSQAATAVRSLQKQTAVTNYLIGQDQKNWRSNVKNFGRVAYENVYQGVDVHYYGNEGRLEYDFLVKPGASPEQISLQFPGVSDLSLDELGQLVLGVGDTSIVQQLPIAYQLTPEGRKPIEASYKLEGGKVSFNLAAYDPSLELIIDPVVEYASYYGGSGDEITVGGGIDAAGNIYAVGLTNSPGLATSGAFVETNIDNRVAVSVFPTCTDCTDTLPEQSQVERTIIQNFSNVFISKFSSDGDTLIYTTYLRPENVATGTQPLRVGSNSVGVSDAGEVAIAFDGIIDGMPLVNSTQDFEASEGNTYIVKLNAAGSGLVFSTYLNLGTQFGFNNRGLAVSATGEVAAVGSVGASNSFPAVNALPGQSCTLGSEGDPLSSDFGDAYVVYFDAAGDITFSSCFGGETRTAGSIIEAARGVDISPNGNIYVLGTTAFDDFPLVDAIQPTHGYVGSRDMFITEIDPDPNGSSILFSTFFGPPTANAIPDFFGISQSFFPADIKVDANRNIWVTGVTNQIDYPMVNAAQPNLANPQSSARSPSSNYGLDWFLTKINPCVGVIFSTFVGGSGGEDSLNSLQVDADGNSYVYGITDSDDYPTASPIQATKNGAKSTVLSKFSPAGRLSFSTYLGGTEELIAQTAGGIDINANDEIVLIGTTTAADFPTLNPEQAALAGGFDTTITILSQEDDDTDGDGVIDSSDAFPNDIDEWLNSDTDNIGNNEDTDDDGDNVIDTLDAFPLDITESLDNDNDGVGNNLDQFDDDPNETFDLDDDGTGDFADPDIDGDEVPNGGPFDLFEGDDGFVFDATRSQDNDRDGTEDSVDLDDDNDGTEDEDDPKPFDPEAPVLTFENFNPLDTETFKSPLPKDFSQAAGTTASWTLETGNAFAGFNSLGSFPIAENESAGIEITQTYQEGMLSFQYEISSQAGLDTLKFFVDGVEMLSVSGMQDWTEFQTPVTAGQHTFRWVYEKDGTIDVGTDSARIDNLKLPPLDLGQICVPVRTQSGRITLICL